MAWQKRDLSEAGGTCGVGEHSLFLLECVTVPFSGLKGEQLWPFVKGIDEVDGFYDPVSHSKVYHYGPCPYCTHGDGWGRLLRSGSEVEGDNSSHRFQSFIFGVQGSLLTPWTLSCPGCSGDAVL